MELLERRAQLAELEAALRDARAGHGSVVLVTGDAGAGKTVLVARFAGQRPDTRVLFGLCDNLLTPRPFGPFRDMFGHLTRAMTTKGEPGPVAEFLDGVLNELEHPPHPAVAVVEDAQWADAATLDAIRFIGRRIGRMRALLVVTYRDDEVPADHPLRRALGAISGQDVRRIRLEPLSVDAVAQLAERPDVTELYELTGGNPFFVREVLAAPDMAVPATVQDAVLARVGRLSERGRHSVDLISVVPGYAERWLAEASGVDAGVDEAARLGVVNADGQAITFSHELARRAVEQSLSSSRRRELNSRILSVLADRQGADPSVETARLVHHAVQAGDADATVRYAPVAARQATDLESHREAADHYEQALRHADRFSGEQLADLLDDCARECYLAGRHERAESALDRAIELHRAAGDVERLGTSLSLLSDVQWFRGLGQEAESSSLRAIQALERQAPGAALARAYAQRAKLAMVGGVAKETIRWGEKAIDLARRLDLVDVLAQALDTVGCAEFMVPPFDDRKVIESIELARTSGLEDAAARALHNLADGHICFLRHDQAEPYLTEGLELCETHDLITGHNHLIALRGQWNLDLGHWSEAESDALSIAEIGDVSRVDALGLLGLVRARRGDPRAEETLDEALRLAELTWSVQRLLAITAARAEFAWLQDRPELTVLTPMAEKALAAGPSPWVSRSVFWMHRVREIDHPRTDLLEPYALQIAGQWDEAARRWAQLGMPYEQADALSESSQPEQLLEALGILDRLGAAPLAAKIRRRLADLGVTSVPRGPREATRSSPAGLTARQTEVLRLLADDLSYQQIAARLHLSVKTVDHHVAAVRMKLDANTRGEAVAEGRRIGILPANRT